MLPTNTHICWVPTGLVITKQDPVFMLVRNQTATKSISAVGQTPCTDKAVKGFHAMMVSSLPCSVNTHICHQCCPTLRVH